MGLVSDTNQCSTNNGDQETKLLMDNQVCNYPTQNKKYILDFHIVIYILVLDR